MTPTHEDIATQELGRDAEFAFLLNRAARLADAGVRSRMFPDAEIVADPTLAEILADPVLGIAERLPAPEGISPIARLAHVRRLVSSDDMPYLGPADLAARRRLLSLYADEISHDLSVAAVGHDRAWKRRAMRLMLQFRVAALLFGWATISATRVLSQIETLF